MKMRKVCETPQRDNLSSGLYQGTWNCESAVLPTSPCNLYLQLLNLFSGPLQNLNQLECLKYSLCCVVLTHTIL